MTVKTIAQRCSLILAGLAGLAWLGVPALAFLFHDIDFALDADFLSSLCFLALPMAILAGLNAGWWRLHQRRRFTLAITLATLSLILTLAWLFVLSAAAAAGGAAL